MVHYGGAYYKINLNPNPIKNPYRTINEGPMKFCFGKIFVVHFPSVNLHEWHLKVAAKNSITFCFLLKKYEF